MIKCPRFNCDYKLTGLTGYKELDNLITHFRRKHKIRIDLNEAMQFRELAERNETNNKKNN